MHETNHLPPERMTPEQRRGEVAFLLAQGLVRLREAGWNNSQEGAGRVRLYLASPARRAFIKSPPTTPTGSQNEPTRKPFHPTPIRYRTNRPAAAAADGRDQGAVAGALRHGEPHPQPPVPGAADRLQVAGERVPHGRRLTAARAQRPPHPGADRDREGAEARPRASPPARHGADPRVPRHRAPRGRHAGRAVRVPGPALSQTLHDRPRDHRHPLVRAAVLRPQGRRKPKNQKKPGGRR